MINEEHSISDNYKSIYNKLKKVTTLFLKSRSEDDLKDFILGERRRNSDGLKNSLIDIPNDNIKSKIERDYTKINYLEGDLGTIEENDQFDGITNMALLMLMSNRSAKNYSSEKTEHLTKEQQAICQKNKSTLLRWKHLAMKDLIANLYIINKTNSIYKDFFSYGYRKDYKGDDSFVIDLPFFGQICVHSGKSMPTILNNARETAIGIMEKKQEMGQISAKDLEVFVQELQNDSILPNYSGKLYEYTAAVPIEYEGEKIKNIKKNLGLDKKLPEDITKEDIIKIKKIGLNSREIYYIAIKLGLSKQRLEEIVQMDRNRLDAKKIGKIAMQSTTAEERDSIRRQERNRQISINHSKSK